MKKIIISSTLAILFVICGMAGISEALPIFLTDAGWSDPNVGTWDAVTRTATLTTDINQTIQIDTNNITLDGNGHTITGESIGYGVILSERSGITITNLNVQQFDFGIYLNSSSNNTLIGNTSDSNDNYGIHLFNSDGNTLANNTFTSNNWSGIFLSSSDNNTITNNTTSNNSQDGIGLSSSSSNTLTNNTVTSI